MAIGDFNNDTNLDLGTANSGEDSISILLGNRDGTFQNEKKYGVGPQPQSIAVGDFNKDTKLDVVTANEGENSISILLGYGNGMKLVYIQNVWL